MVGVSFVVSLRISFLLSLLYLLESTVFASESFNVSTVFNDHMVLQRNTNAKYWGFASIGSTITLTIDHGQPNEQNVTTVTDTHGIFTLILPTYPAGGPHTFLTVCNKGCVDSESYFFSDIFFGDVFLCGGQSNMAYETELLSNSSTELAIADNPRYRTIRLFQVGTLDTFSVPVRSLQHVDKTWTSPNHTSVADFAALCWLVGRNIFDGLNASVPIGLISSNVGGTPIQEWLPKEALDSCSSVRPHNDPYNSSNSGLFNSMISPFTLPGPLSITGMLWWQGEANVAFNQSIYYSCAFPALIESWRQAFSGGVDTNVWFGYVQLQAFSQYASPEHNDTYDIPWFRRDAQFLPTRGLPNVSFASAINIGDPLSPLKDIHPRDKQPVGIILAKAALYNIYGISNGTYASPNYASSLCSQNLDTVGNMWTVKVSFNFDSLTSRIMLVTPPDCPTNEGVPANLCSTYGILGNDGIWYNATVSSTDNETVLLSAQLPPNVHAIAHGYGWSAWPLTSLYASDSIVPVLPWLESCT